VYQFKAIGLSNFFRNEKRFPCDTVDGFMRFDFSKSCVLVAGISEAAHKKPLHRITLQFHPERSVWRRCL
jgi:hypothetical protein